MPTAPPWRSPAQKQRTDSELLNAALEQLTIAQMRAIARRFDWPLGGTRRADVAEQIRAAYLDDALAARAIKSLAKEERRLLALIAWLGWSGRYQLPRRLETLQEALPRGWLGRAGNEEQVRNLIEAGFLFRAPGVGYTENVGVLESFARHLLPIPELLPAPADVGALRPDPVVDPLSLLLTAWYAARDAQPVRWQSPYPEGIVQHGKQWPQVRHAPAIARKSQAMIETSPATTPFPPEVLAPLQPLLDESAPGGAPFFAGLLLAAGLLRGGSRAHVDERALRTFLTLSFEEQWTKLFTAWFSLAYGIWEEFTWVSQQRDSYRVWRGASTWHFLPESFSGALKKIREQAAALLDWLPVSKDRGHGWVAFDSLSRLLWAVTAGDFVPDAANGAWRAGPSARATEYRGTWESWRLTSEPLLEYLLRGPLRWLGVVQSATHGGRLAAVRLTPVGRALREHAPPPATGGAALAWEEDLSASLELSAANIPLLTFLQRVATEEGLRQGRLRLRFTPQAAHIAFEQDLTPAAQQEALARWGIEMPEALRVALAQWWERWGLVHEYTDLALIELSDELLMRELLQAAGIAEYVVYRAGPTALAIRETDVELVVAELERKSYMPRVVKGEDDV